MSIIVDATKTPDIGALKSAGVIGICRYISWLYRYGGKTHTTINPKIMTPGDYENIVSHGMGVIPNWEFDARDWLGGASAGHQHAAEFLRQVDAFDYPKGHALAGSADFDMTLAQWNAEGKQYCEAFSHDIRSAGYKMMAYGPWDVLEWGFNAGYLDYGWQAGMSWAWSQGRNKNIHPKAALFQAKHVTIGGIDCDQDNIVKTDCGIYIPSGSPPITVPVGNPVRPKLLEDGILGKNTITWLENHFRTPVDGFITEIPGRSSLVKAIQIGLNKHGAGLKVDSQGFQQDGKFYKTTKAMQHFMHTTEDGKLSEPTSECVKAIQHAANNGTFNL